MEDEVKQEQPAQGGLEISGMKSPFGGKYAGNVVASASPEMLENMQRLIDQRTGGFHDFLESMKDAVAITSRDPGTAMAARDQSRRLEQQSIFDMRNQMAMLKQQAKQNEIESGSLNTQLGKLGYAGAGAGGAGGAGDVLGSGLDKNILANVAELNRLGHTEEAKKYLMTHMMDVAKANATGANAQGYFDSTIRVPNPASPDGFDLYSRAQIDANPQLKAKILGKSLPSVAPSTGPVGAKDAVAAGVPVLSGDRTNEQQWKLYDDWVAGGRKGNPVARPGTSKHESGNALDVDMNKVTQDHLAWLKNNGYYQPAWATDKNNKDYDPNHWERKVGLTPISPINIAGIQQQPSGPQGLTPSQINRPDVQKAGEIAQAQKTGELYAAGENTLRTQGQSSGGRQAIQNSTMNLLEDPELQSMVGKFQTGEKAAGFVRQMQAGIQAGNFGAFGLKELQENLAKSGASPSAIRKFEQLQANLKQNELEWSTNYLKGQGSVSDNERRLVQQAIGSVNDPIGKLKTLTATMRERALFDGEVYADYKQWKRSAGAGANFGEYLDSDRYNSLNDKHNGRLATILNMDPVNLKSNDGFKLGASAPSPVKPYDDAAKEKRYQDWLAKNKKG